MNAIVALCAAVFLFLMVGAVVFPANDADRHFVEFWKAAALFLIAAGIWWGRV